jgi:hypothetical protein
MSETNTVVHLNPASGISKEADREYVLARELQDLRSFGEIGFDEYRQQVLGNQPATTVSATRSWCKGLMKARGVVPTYTEMRRPPVLLPPPPQ